jgi:hypothetical protein
VSASQGAFRAVLKAAAVVPHCTEEYAAPDGAEVSQSRMPVSQRSRVGLELSESRLLPVFVTLRNWVTSTARREEAQRLRGHGDKAGRDSNTPPAGASLP